MDLSDAGDEIDRKIVTALRFGKKRQKEIIALIDRNESTVRSHLDRLTDMHEEICKEEKGGAFYYIESEGKKLIRPKPTADAEEVNRLLYDIKQRLGSERDEPPQVSRMGSFSETIQNFYAVSSKNYYVLENRDNMRYFLDVFDEIINIICRKNEGGVLTDPESTYEFFFMATDNIYSNWENGMENEEFHMNMSERIGKIHLAFQHSSSDIERTLQSLLVHIDIREGQKAFIEMVKSGDYSQDDLLIDAFYSYDYENQIDVLIDDLHNAKKDVSKQRMREIEELVVEIKRLYCKSNPN